MNMDSQSMSAVLCCGPCFDPNYLAEDGDIYPWLDTLLTSKHEKVMNFELIMHYASYNHFTDEFHFSYRFIISQKRR